VDGWLPYVVLNTTGRQSQGLGPPAASRHVAIDSVMSVLKKRREIAPGRQAAGGPRPGTAGCLPARGNSSPMTRRCSRKSEIINASQLNAKRLSISASDDDAQRKAIEDYYRPMMPLETIP
jgi:hypothetical protein